MRLTSLSIAIAAFALAASVSWLGAVWAVTVIETRSSQAVAQSLTANGQTWATASADGLQVRITGIAPTEAERFRALTAAGALIDQARIRDDMSVTAAKPITAPHFSLELLRNDDGISLIGLIPTATGRDDIVTRITALAAGATVTDMLETADHPVPDGWDTALTYGLEALSTLPRSKISISAERVAITAISDSADEKRRFEAQLARTAPRGLPLAISITAPRPVITPFTLRFLIDADGPRFDACSADTEAARTKILNAATAAGLTGTVDCVIGLGVPSPNWAQAVATSIAGLAELGTGSVTFSDADISLIAGETVTQAAFDRVVGDLEAKLPKVFSLDSVMPPKASGNAAAVGPPEFTATLSAEGQVQLRGRLPDERVRDAVDSYARSRFGSQSVYTAARLDPNLPDGWPVRVLSALEAMAELHHGDIKVQQDKLEVRGVTGNPGASANISRILSEKLGQGRDFRIIVSYDKALDPNAGLPTPKECAANIAALLSTQKISFEPGVAEIDPTSYPTLDGIAKVLTKCGAIPLEIGGYTDAQGRDEMNLALSQSRAEAVLQALSDRRVLVAGLTARGYGETLPIGDNTTEAGREANRRIDFKLLLSAAEADKIATETVAADPDAPAAGSGDAGTAANPPVTEGATPGTPANDAQPEAGGVVVRPAAENQTHPKPRPAQD